MRTVSIEPIAGGTVTSAAGFRAGATHAGIKKDTTRLDLGILFSEEPCVVAGVLTTNMVKSAPVLVCRKRLERGRAMAVVVNSGCANASTGERGLSDAEEMAALTAKALGTEPEDILVAGTGVIGKMLPLDKIKAALNHIILSVEGGHDLARAIMTTDTVPKEIALAVHAGNLRFTLGGVTKGAGMIHPNMATMLCFLATDATVAPDFLRTALVKAVDVSFNMISVDGDTSPSDTVLLLANGRAGNQSITEGSVEGDAFQQALEQACTYLAKAIARDGEGATRLIEVTVQGAASARDARLAARTIVSSSLVKSAVYGADPNWGRVLAAVGRSGAEVVESKIDLRIGEVEVVRGGMPLSFDEKSVVAVLKQPEVPVLLDLNLGKGQATAWGCDLTPDYVKINSEYMT